MGCCLVYAGGFWPAFIFILEDLPPVLGLLLILLWPGAIILTTVLFLAQLVSLFTRKEKLLNTLLGVVGFSSLMLLLFFYWQFAPLKH